MKLYTSIGPNPRVVKMFIAEKGLEIPRVEMDLMGAENRQPAHVARNPSGQSPTLELDDGAHLSEITAICEYLEEKHPQPPLIGTTPEARAETRMWVRRIDLYIVEPMLMGFRGAEGKRLFESRMRIIPQASDDLKALAREKLVWLNGLMEGRQYVCGDRFTLADILLYCMMEFGGTVGQGLDPENKAIAGVMERVRARPSAAASA